MPRRVGPAAMDRERARAGGEGAAGGGTTGAIGADHAGTTLAVVIGAATGTDASAQATVAFAGAGSGRATGRGAVGTTAAAHAGTTAMGTGEDRIGDEPSAHAGGVTAARRTGPPASLQAG